jgi:hypothetical protein
MNRTLDAVKQRSTIRKLGLKNLAVCAGWFLVAIFLFLTREWFAIQKFLQGLAQSFSGGSNTLEPLLSAVASILAVTILIGWVFGLPSALIMTLTGYYPRFLGYFTLIKPEKKCIGAEKD